MGASASDIDYFMLGTITRDLTAEGAHVVGGTCAFAAATAHALGQRVGLCARFGSDVDLSVLSGVEVLRQPSEVTTTFENRYTKAGREQVLHARAAPPTLEGVPASWLRAPIVHLGPLAQDLDPDLARCFPGSLLGVTPQGWLRAWDDRGRVRACEFERASEVLAHASAVVLSIEDVAYDWSWIEAWAGMARVLVVTRAEHGATVYAQGTRRRFAAPEVAIADPTGAGDMFAAIYLVEYRALRDPFAACARAVWLTSTLLAEREQRFPDPALVARLSARAP